MVKIWIDEVESLNPVDQKKKESLKPWWDV